MFHVELGDVPTDLLLAVKTRAERDERFPELPGLEAGTVSLCAVPLELPGGGASARCASASGRPGCSMTTSAAS
jgi:hypothetical protein